MRKFVITLLLVFVTGLVFAQEKPRLRNQSWWWRWLTPAMRLLPLQKKEPEILPLYPNHEPPPPIRLRQLKPSIPSKKEPIYDTAGMIKASLWSVFKSR